MKEGWVKLYRGIEDSAIWQDAHMLRLALYCILRANYRDQEWLVPGTGEAITVARGSFVTGRESLHNALYPTNRGGDPSVSTLWRKLKNLSKIGFISVTNLNNRASLVTVCNYSLYQHNGEYGWTEVAPPVDNRWKTDEQPVNTIEECKKDKKVRSNSGAQIAAEASEPAEDFVLVFPCSGKPSSWGLSVRQIDEWGKAYPGLEVEQECRKAREWLIASGRPKTARGTRQFLVNWLNRATDSQRWKATKRRDEAESRVPSVFDLENWNAIDGGIEQ